MVNIQIVTFRWTAHNTDNWWLGSTFSPIGLGLVAWLVFSLLQVSLTGIGFIHYYLILVPVLALLAAWEMNELEVRFTQVSPALRRLLVWGAALAILLNSAIVNRDVYVHYVRYRMGLDTYQSFLTGRLGYGNVDMRMRSVARYIQSHSTPQDTIYAWSNDVQLYYLADRRCALETSGQPISQREGRLSAFLICNPCTLW